MCSTFSQNCCPAKPSLWEQLISTYMQKYRLHKVNIWSVTLLRLHTSLEFLFRWCERWHQIDRNRWGLKEKCRNKGNVTEGAHTKKSQWPPPTVSTGRNPAHNQCQYGWSSMTVGWRINSHHGHQNGSHLVSSRSLFQQQKDGIPHCRMVLGQIPWKALW